MTTLRAGSATDTGLVRRNNQDQLLMEPTLFAVADGMGGHAAGEVASLTAVEALKAAFGDPSQEAKTADDLRSAVRWANRTVYQRAQDKDDLRGMGTTLTAVATVVADGETRLAVANVGDSRAYVFVQGELTQLTEDHSVPEELVRQGQLDAEDVATHPQRHILTRALGITLDVEVDLWEVLPFAGDRILLCSDGLCRELTDEQIASVLRRLADPNEAARELVQQARANGGADNITVVVIDVVDDGGRSREASVALGAEPTRLASHPTPPIPAPEAYDEPDLDAGPPVGGQDQPSAATATATARPRRRRVTLGVIGFVIVLGLILGVAAAAVTYYARQTYYVGLGPGGAQSVQPILIYRGRPGGVLWFKPTIQVRTTTTTADVLAGRLADLRNGKISATVADAQAYITRLVTEAALVKAAAAPGPTSGATTSTLPSLPPLPPSPRPTAATTVP